MNKFYNISRGQVIVLWFFGVVGWMYALNGSYNDYLSALLKFILWFISFFLVFYTVGWRNKRKLG